MYKDVNNFFDHWPRIKETLKEKEIFLFLDYDGTLAPLVDHPMHAVMPPDTKKILYRLSRNKHCHVAIVSGRALNDLKERIGLENIIYVGNHGFEISGPNICFENNDFSQSRKIFDYIIEELREVLTSMPAVFIEDKEITLSIHVRRLEADMKPVFEKSLHKIIGPYVHLKNIHLYEGKEVYELRPMIEWDKGKASLWLLKERAAHRMVYIYIGDDRTDEDAFNALKDSAITIRVGGGQTAAHYYLDSPDDVQMLLAKILFLKTNQKKTP